MTLGTATGSGGGLGVAGRASADTLLLLLWWLMLSVELSGLFGVGRASKSLGEAVRGDGDDDDADAGDPGTPAAPRGA